MKKFVCIHKAKGLSNNVQGQLNNVQFHPHSFSVSHALAAVHNKIANLDQTWETIAENQTLQRKLGKQCMQWGELKTWLMQQENAAVSSAELQSMGVANNCAELQGFLELGDFDILVEFWMILPSWHGI